MFDAFILVAIIFLTILFAFIYFKIYFPSDWYEKAFNEDERKNAGKKGKFIILGVLAILIIFDLVSYKRDVYSDKDYAICILIGLVVLVIFENIVSHKRK